ncbi:MAG: winged helix-turn-helix domain-containing protein [Pseudomonadota bacterium]
MNTSPNFSRIAALIADPARAGMLAALMSGKALTATELSREAGVTPQTASSHLGKLTEGGLVTASKHGRHRYYALSGPDIANLLETLMGVAAAQTPLKTHTGPKRDDMREARVCYNHLAGRRGIQMYDAMKTKGFFAFNGDEMQLTQSGIEFTKAFNVDLTGKPVGRTPICRECLDWSGRRPHLAGVLGRAMFARLLDLGWARRDKNSRVVRFTPKGSAEFDRMFRVPDTGAGSLDRYRDVL